LKVEISMLTRFRAGLLATVLSAYPALSETPAVPSPVYILSVHSESRSYGLWVTAPETGCHTVRYVVASQSTFLGHSPPLQAGDSAMIRLGRGFSLGDHVLDVTGIGCDLPPASARRVVLGKESHDYSWLWK
jgi:hypothetical protein